MTPRKPLPMTTKPKAVPFTRRKPWHRPGDRWEWRGSFTVQSCRDEPLWTGHFWRSLTWDVEICEAKNRHEFSADQRRRSLRRIPPSPAAGRKGRGCG